MQNVVRFELHAGCVQYNAEHGAEMCPDSYLTLTKSVNHRQLFLFLLFFNPKFNTGLMCVTMKVLYLL